MWADTHLLPGYLWLELQCEVHGDVWDAQGTVLGGISLWPTEEFHQIICARLCLFLFWLGCFLFHSICIFKCQLYLKRRKQNVWFFNKADIILFIHFNKGRHALTGIARSAQSGDSTSERGQKVKTVSPLVSVSSSLHSGGYTYIWNYKCLLIEKYNILHKTHSRSCSHWLHREAPWKSRNPPHLSAE